MEQHFGNIMVTWQSGINNLYGGAIWQYNLYFTVVHSLIKVKIQPQAGPKFLFYLIFGPQTIQKWPSKLNLRIKRQFCGVWPN